MNFSHLCTIASSKSTVIFHPLHMYLDCLLYQLHLLFLPFGAPRLIILLFFCPVFKIDLLILKE